jgi:formylglycine-generating enzyme required for sulfatase activity
MKIFLSLLFIFPVFLGFSQEVENVFAQQKGNQVSITYQITGAKTGQRFTAKLLISNNGGLSYDYPFNSADLSGDSAIVEAGKREIIWRPQEVKGDNFKFKVEISITEAIPPLPNIMVFVEGGSFKMGSEIGESDEKPVHTVELSDFYISKYEVTNAEYAKFLNAYGSAEVKQGEHKGQRMIVEDVWGIKKAGNTFEAQSGYENHPVVYVTWYGANEYCKFYNARLPTEAQWEYAARGGNQSNGYIYSGSDYIEAVAWYYENSYDLGSSHKDYGTHAVGGKQANELGLYDMSGNVWEWCSDWYSSTYNGGSPTKNPENTTKATYCVFRGGSWISYADCRSARRNNGTPSNYSNRIGFRVVSF